MSETPDERIERMYCGAQFAPTHDLSRAGYAHYDRVYAAAFGRHLPADRQARILDLGCGAGHFLHFLRSAGYGNVVGVDGSAEQVALCQRMGLGSVERADAFEHLRAHRGEYQVIAGNHLIEHLSREQAVELCVLARDALAPGGAFIVTTPNMSNLLAGRMLHADLTHRTGFTEDSLRHCLAAGGFERIEIVEGGVPISSLGRVRALVERLVHRGVYVLCSQPVPRVCSCSLMGIGRG
jgi:SAM-dependent methyltransferase